MRMINWPLAALALLLAVAGNLHGVARGPQPVAAATSEEEFVGPFASWANLKSGYGAVGDGLADDTAALQRALDDLGTPGKSSVLYLPNGTYRVSTSLRLKGREGVRVIGQDPAKTRLRWAGPAAGTLFVFEGVSYSALSRLTLDGAGTTAVLLDNRWSGNGNYFPTGNEYADLFFQDSAVCLRVGADNGGTAETVVIRAKFLRCSDKGVLVQNYNALDWFIWDSLFEDNGVGVYNESGGFHVYHSVFRRSTQADITIRNKLFFAFRYNYSSGSKRFLESLGPSGNPSGITLQANTILDTSEPDAIRVNDAGPLLLFDNVIRNAGASGPAVVQSDFQPGVVVGAGNTFTVDKPYNVDSRSAFTTLDDRTVARASLSPAEPTLPGVQTSRNRPIIDVAAGANAATIQAALDQAATKNGQRPVVHLPAAEYAITATLNIPANSDMQIVGDGLFRSKLAWRGSGTGPLVRVRGPSQATLRDLDLLGGTIAGDVLMLDGADQAGGRILADQLFVSGKAGIFVDGLDATRFDLRTYYANSVQGGQAALRVRGGPQAASGAAVTAATHVYAGATSNNDTNLDVSNGGRVTYTDIWFEGQSQRMLRLGGKSVVTMSSNNYAVNTALPYAEYASDFAGRFTLVGIRTGTKLDTPATLGNGARVLALANIGTRICNGKMCGTNMFANNAPGRAFYVSNLAFGDDIAGAVAPVPNAGSVDDAALRAFLAQLRERDYPPLDAPLASSGRTDVRLYRVSASGGITPVHVVGGGGAAVPFVPKYNVYLPYAQAR